MLFGKRDRDLKRKQKERKAYERKQKELRQEMEDDALMAWLEFEDIMDEEED